MNKRREGEKTQKLYSVAKEDHSKKDHSFMMSAKTPKIPTSHVLPLSWNNQFWSELIPLFNALNWNSIPHRSNFGIFHENFNN